MKKFIAPIMLMMTLTSFAGNEKGNGGDIIKNRLRDIIDTDTCIWRGQHFALEQAPEISNILSRAKTINPHFAYKMDTQFNKIKWCLTGKLKKVNTDDKEGLVHSLRADSFEGGNNKTQIGVRTEDYVLIDSQALKKLKVSDRAYFFVHEATHGLIPKDSQQRNSTVRAVVKLLHMLMGGTLTSGDFEMNLKTLNLNILSGDSEAQRFVKILEGNSELEAFYSEKDRDQMLKMLKQFFSTEELLSMGEKTGLPMFEFVANSLENKINGPGFYQGSFYPPKTEVSILLKNGFAKIGSCHLESTWCPGSIPSVCLKLANKSSEKIIKSSKRDLPRVERNGESFSLLALSGEKAYMLQDEIFDRKFCD